MPAGATAQAPVASVTGALSPLRTEDAVNDLLRYAKEEHARFGTGWSIDDTCGCVGAGELALWIARSGTGKSTAYLNIIRNTPEVPTVVFNMEMTPRRQIEWLTAMTHDLQTPARHIEEVLRFGDDDDRHGEVVSALQQMGERYPNLHFVMPSRPTVADLAFVLDDIEDATGTRPVRVFIDHVGLMAGCDDYRGTVLVTSGLHSLALREELAINAVQQTGRNDGAGGRNDGHIPVTYSAGLFAGDADADWMMGLYRPDRNPRFQRSRHQFSDEGDYFDMLTQLDRVRGLTILQVLKNRTFGDILESGIELTYDPHTRRLSEVGGF